MQRDGILTGRREVNLLGPGLKKKIADGGGHYFIGGEHSAFSEETTLGGSISLGKECVGVLLNL